MATTPTRSLKRTLASTVEDRSPRFLLGSLALAMVISLLAGLGIGIKVEQHRIKTKKAKPAATAVKKPKKPAKRTVSAALLAGAPVKGTVLSLGPKFLVVTNPPRRVRVVMASKTRIEVAGSAAQSDIVVGAHVLFVLTRKATAGTGSSAPAAGGTASAKEIVIVTANGLKGRLGSVVTAVTSDSMTVKGVGGKTVTISTVGAKIEKTAAGKRTALATGAHVIVRTYQAKAVRVKAHGRVKAHLVKPPRIAVEIVVLPAATAFA